MTLLNVDSGPTYEAMKRGEWPEPNPEVVAAHKALSLEVEYPDGSESRHHRIGGSKQRGRRRAGEVGCPALPPVSRLSGP